MPKTEQPAKTAPEQIAAVASISQSQRAALAEALEALRDVERLIAAAAALYPTNPMGEWLLKSRMMASVSAALRKAMDAGESLPRPDGPIATGPFATPPTSPKTAVKVLAKHGGGK